jgi:hypothetical protein
MEGNTADGAYIVFNITAAVNYSRGIGEWQKQAKTGRKRLKETGR